MKMTQTKKLLNDEWRKKKAEGNKTKNGQINELRTMKQLNKTGH